MAQISGFGSVPTNWLRYVPYFLRVYTRKRVLAEELGELAQHRKRAATRLNEAFFQTGEALFAERNDPTLAALARHFQIVQQADSQVDSRLAASNDAEREAMRELSKREKRIQAADETAEPVRKRAAHVRQAIETLTQRSAKAQAAYRELDQQIRDAESPQASLEQRVDLHRLKASKAEHENKLAELHNKVKAWQGEQVHAQRKLELHEAAIATEQAAYDEKSAIVEREQVRNRRSAGDARDALQRTLKALAISAIEQNLTQHVPRRVAAIVELKQELKQRSQSEATHRAALKSYDPNVYRYGQWALVGGTAMAFVTLIALVFS